jgi:hypothetical protein
MEKHMAYYELLKQLAQPACPVCALAARRTHAFLERYLEEGVVHEDTWDRLAAAGGWCGRHAREIEGFDDGLAVALFYGHLLKKKEAALKAGQSLLPHEPGRAAAPGWLDRLRGAEAQLACTACDIEQETERTQAHLVAKALEEPEAVAAMQAHPGFCLGHVDLVLARTSGEAKAAFAAQQGAKLQALADELELFVRHSEHSSTGSGQVFGAERDAWKRALRRYYGLKLGEA